MQRNINLVLTNAMLYNKRDSRFHRTAKRIHGHAQALLDELVAITARSHFAMPTYDEASASPSGAIEDVAGDLEPSSLLLRALLEAPRDETDRDHLSSVFAFELRKPRPPTPPPPTPPEPRAHKYVSAAERKERWDSKEAAAKERAVAGRSTRAVKAMAKAFAEEAGVQPSSDIELPGPSIRARHSPSRREARKIRANMRDDAPSTVAEEESESSVRRQSKPQRGVAGVEAVAVLSDKERRDLERRMDILTEQVDSQDQFKRFNVGWVLPEGSKRRRSERPPAPGPSMPLICEVRNRPQRSLLTFVQLKNHRQRDHRKLAGHPRPLSPTTSCCLLRRLRIRAHTLPVRSRLRHLTKRMAYRCPTRKAKAKDGSTPGSHGHPVARTDSTRKPGLYHSLRTGSEKSKRKPIWVGLQREGPDERKLRLMRMKR